MLTSCFCRCMAGSASENHVCGTMLFFGFLPEVSTCSSKMTENIHFHKNSCQDTKCDLQGHNTFKN